MTDTVDFGAALQCFREERTLSLRELGTLSGVDHAYIHRLEAGDKVAPSAEIVEKLVRALKLTAQKRQLLDLLQQSGPIDATLFLVAVSKPEHMSAIQAAASMSFRGSRPDSEAEWLRKIEQIEDLMGNDRG
jgi:transcriptional regulator with XRE-family HTH domain